MTNASSDLSIETETEARLATYLLKFSSRGHKAMITELWTKGRATYSRLRGLRGTYGVTANADRTAIDRLVAKVERLWINEGRSVSPGAATGWLWKSTIWSGSRTPTVDSAINPSS